MVKYRPVLSAEKNVAVMWDMNFSSENPQLTKNKIFYSDNFLEQPKVTKNRMRCHVSISLWQHRQNAKYDKHYLNCVGLVW